MLTFNRGACSDPKKSTTGGILMDASNKEFALAVSLEELKAKGRIVVHGGHRPILVIYDRGRVFALDNRCPHMGFPLERGSVEDGILTCHWHHARLDLESGCTFDLWADDVPICPVEVRNGDVWVKTTFGHADPAAHWHQRLANGLAHGIGLVMAKAVHGQLAADVPPADIVRQVALFGAQNRDGWGVGLMILTALANLLPVLPEEEAYLAMFHGARRVAGDCDGEAPRRERAQPAGTGRAQALAAALDKRAPPRGGRAHPAYGDCSRVFRRLCLPMPCSRPRPSGCSPIPDTRSTSSTRRSSAST
jgi:nitrite reductase/ring-hydroxylating ferredoxin subunit